jgi:nucleoside-diphosphate-sugar epimerase
MKSLLLTGANGTVAYALKKELSGTYDISGMSIPRMDEVLRDLKATTWKEQLDAYREKVMGALLRAFEGKDAIAHLGWNTDDENYKGGLDPLNILVVDCVYQAAIEARVSRIYLASSVHAYDFDEAIKEDRQPITPFPDTREDAFGAPTTSLYGVSKRWMEIAGQFYAKRLQAEQKILVVRLGAVGRDEKPHRGDSRLWDSHADLAGLLSAFIENKDGPSYWVAFGVSDNHGGDYPRPLFDATNPYGFKPADNAQTEF